MATYRCQVQAYQLEAQEIRSGEFVYVAEDDLQPLRTRLQGLGVQV